MHLVRDGLEAERCAILCPRRWPSVRCWQQAAVFINVQLCDWIVHLRHAQAAMLISGCAVEVLEPKIVHNAVLIACRLQVLGDGSTISKKVLLRDLPSIRVVAVPSTRWRFCELVSRGSTCQRG